MEITPFNTACISFQTSDLRALGVEETCFCSAGQPCSLFPRPFIGITLNFSGSYEGLGFNWAKGQKVKTYCILCLSLGQAGQSSPLRGSEWQLSTWSHCHHILYIQSGNLSANNHKDKSWLEPVFRGQLCFLSHTFLSHCLEASFQTVLSGWSSFFRDSMQFFDKKNISCHKWTDLQNRKGLRDLENKLTVARARGGREGQLGSLGRSCVHCYILNR